MTTKEIEELKITLKERKQQGLENNHLFFICCRGNALEMCKYMFENNLLDEKDSKNRDFVWAAYKYCLQQEELGNKWDLTLLKYLVEICNFKPHLDTYEQVRDSYHSLLYPKFSEILKYFVSLGYDFKYDKSCSIISPHCIFTVPNTNIQIQDYMNFYHYATKNNLYSELQKESHKLNIFLNKRDNNRYLKMEILSTLKLSYLFTPFDIFNIS